jgi:hypothetical protein
MSTIEPTNPSELFTPFLGTTINVPEDKERLNTFLNDEFARFADVINQKTIGVITPSENFNGESWSYISTRKVRNGFQVIAYIPSLPNAGATTLTLTSNPAFPIAGIDSNFVVTQVYGSASKSCSAIGVGDGVYFSFMSQGDTRISFTMSDIQIVVTTTVDLRAYSCFLVINYLRDGK